MQIINFYHPQPKSTFKELKSEHFFKILAGLLGLLFLFYFLQVGYYFYQKGKLSNLQSQQTQLLKALQTAQAGGSPNTQLKLDIQAIQQEIVRKQAEVGELQQLFQQDNIGLFINYLNGFARTIVTDVWLTDITISNGGQSIVINGKTISSTALAKFFLNLSHDKAFKGKKFKILSVKSDKDASLVFLIATDSQPDQGSKS